MGGLGSDSPGLGRRQQGEAATGIARIRDRLAAYGTTGARLTTPLFLTLLAEALALAGKIEEGLPTLDDALAKATASGERGWDAEVHRLHSELTGRLPYPDPAKAEESFRTALAIPASKIRGATNCAPPRASPGCAASRAGGAKPATCWYPSTPRSPKASTPPT